MPNQQAIDTTFRALSDPVRRAIVMALTEGPRPVKALAEPHSLKLPTVLQHLSLLEAGGLVTTRKEGRARIVTLNPEGLRTAENWLADRRALWERRFDRLDEYLKSEKENDT